MKGLRSPTKGDKKWIRILKEEYEEVRILSLIGRFSTILLGRNKALNRFEAIKAIDCLSIGDLGITMEHVNREIEFLAKLDHPNIVKIHNIIKKTTEEEEYIFIVMEYCETTLSEELKKYKGGMPYEKGVKYFLQMVEGVGYLHDHKILHRDLKPDNVLIKDGQIKIGDFNISKKESLEGETTSTKAICTPRYTSPERLIGKGDHRMDSWSLGCMWYEICTGEFAMKGNIEEEVRQNIFDVKYTPHKNIDAQSLSILKMMLTKEHNRKTVLEMRSILRTTFQSSLKAEVYIYIYILYIYIFIY